MTDQSKKGKTTKDYISQIKKGSDNVKDTKAQEGEEIDWERQESDEEEEVQQKKGVVIQQGTVGSDKPKKLKDVFGDSSQGQQQKTKTYKPKEGGFKEKRPQQDQGYDSRKPKFTNSRGVQNKEQPLKQYDSKYEKNYDNKYSSKYEKNDKYEKYEKYEKKDKPAEVPKKFTGLLTAAAEENSKIKPTKNYLEAENKVRYKEEEPQIEKPKFLNKNLEGQEPHFKDINKNEDLFLKKLNEKNVEIENVYSEPKDPNETKEKKQFKEKRPYDGERKHERREEKQQEEKEDSGVDSDGFEIIGHEKKKNEDEEYRPKKKYYNNNKERNWESKKNRGGKGGPRKFQRREGSNEKNKENLKGEDKPEENIESQQKTDEKESEQSKVKVDKATIKIKVDPKATKLKDIFG